MHWDTNKEWYRYRISSIKCRPLINSGPPIHAGCLQFYTNKRWVSNTCWVAVRRAWQTFHVDTQCLISACLQLYSVGTKLEAMDVAFKRTTHEILYGVSGWHPKSLHQRELHCPSSVLYVVLHRSRASRQIYRCDDLSPHLLSRIGTPCVRVGVKSMGE